jgi:hypothetical protein
MKIYAILLALISIGIVAYVPFLPNSVLTDITAMCLLIGISLMGLVISYFFYKAHGSFIKDLDAYDHLID